MGTVGLPKKKKRGNLRRSYLWNREHPNPPTTCWCLGVYGLKDQLIERDFSWPPPKEERSCTGHSTIPRSNQAPVQLPESRQLWGADSLSTPVLGEMHWALPDLKGRSRLKSCTSWTRKSFFPGLSSHSWILCSWAVKRRETRRKTRDVVLALATSGSVVSSYLCLTWRSRFPRTLRGTRNTKNREYKTPSIKTEAASNRGWKYRL